MLQSPKEQKLFNDELRAEIQFGLRNATGNDTLDDYLELVDVFLNHRDEWEIAERNIVGLRKQLTAAGEHEAWLLANLGILLSSKFRALLTSGTASLVLQ